MIHTANTVRWKVGNYVIHDKDAKRVGMLMVVTGCTKNGEYITRYVDRSVSTERYENEMGALHDPRRFDIQVPVHQ